MALKKSNTRTNTAAQSDETRAASFINISIGTRGGDPVRLGNGIPLRLSEAVEAQLHEYLAEAKDDKDLAKRIENLRSRLILSFRVVRDKSELQLDL